MPLGYEVNKGILDQKAGEAVLSLRAALDQIENVAGWLNNNPNEGATPETDPLVTDFGYTTDEAYVLRIFFETVSQLRIANASVIEIGRKMTGLM